MEPSQTPKPPSNRLWIIVGTLVFAGILFSGRMFWRAISPSGSVRFVVERGESVQRIAQHLAQARLISHPSLFMSWHKWPSHRASLKPGVYFFSTNDSLPTLYAILKKGPPPVRVTFPEGWTAKQISQELEEKGVIDPASFLKEVESSQAEGFLFPDTYLFDQGTAPKTIVATLRKRFDAVKPADFDAQAAAMKLTPRQLVILASIVEREARVPSEQPLIAGVFWNRLKKGWRLESCATVLYAMGQWKARLLYEDLKIESPYNTYRHRGLPPGPIGNPGAGALQSASHPAVTDSMFFVADGQGTHQFSAYYKDHLAAQRNRVGKK